MHPQSDPGTAGEFDSNGLTTAQAVERMREFGPNSVVAKVRQPVILEIVKFVTNPLVLMLLGAAVVSSWTGGTTDSIIICAILLLSLGLNVSQSIKSDQAVKDLQNMVNPQAKVLRDGQWTTISRDQLVPGDVVRLAAGDLVPADVRVAVSKDLHVNQACLTGESVPVDKFKGDPGDSPNTPEDPNMLFLGTSVVSGSGDCVVVNTGRNTMFGDIAAALAAKAPPTEFERGTRSFGVLITRTVAMLVMFAFLALIALKRPPLESLMFAIALAVGLTPEFLPMITTITLGRGAIRMAKYKVIVRNLASIQNLGSMDVVCSDKTGTLTTGEMELAASLAPDGAPSDEPLRLAAINSHLESGFPSPLDDAILRARQPQNSVKVDEIPFDFDRRRVSVVAHVDGKRILICKGAPESMIDSCGPSAREILKVSDAQASQGLRTLAVAWKEVAEQATYSIKDEHGLTLAGILAFADPPLPDAMHLIGLLRRSGIGFKVISGDSELVVKHVCDQIGLAVDKVVTGKEIDEADDTAMIAIAEKFDVFARVNPSQKNRIILALKNRGHVVGYMGDGINDAPSLRAADVGISFASGTEVARDAADIILTERGLNVLHRGVLEGRTAFGNVMKYILMGTSSNFGNMFSMAGAAAFLPFLPMLPTQILLNNFLYDLAQITIPTDQVDRTYIRKTHRWDSRIIRNFMVTIGPISSLFDFLTFFVLLKVLKAGEAEFHTGWFVESLATQTLVIFVIRTRLLPWQSRPSLALSASVVSVVAFGIALPYLPFARSLGFVPLPGGYYVFLAVAVVTYLALVELSKRWVLRQLPDSL